MVAVVYLYYYMMQIPMFLPGLLFAGYVLILTMYLIEITAPIAEQMKR
jgi:hypothetical protein